VSQGREVWHAEEAWVSIYLENGDGSYQATPTHSFRFVQNVSIKKAFELIVSGQPGAPDQDIDSIPGVFDCSIGEYYWTKAEQWTPFLNSQSRWRVAFSNVNPYYDGVSQVNDPIVLRNAAIAAPTISWQKNAMQVSALEFKAESVE
jgi:hypothetical protein